MLTLLRKFAAWLIMCDSLLFDLWHNVQTRATEIDFRGKYDNSQGFWYLPTRPSVIRRILRDLPVAEYSEMQFLDFGSGKGRVLLLAAEYPFKKVTGIELRAALHDIATKNLQTQRRFQVRCGSTELLNIDALEFEFPDDDLILYFFNPFGEAVLRSVLLRLRTSVRSTGRKALLVMVKSQFNDLMSSLSEYELLSRSRRRTIYRIKGV